MNEHRHSKSYRPVMTGGISLILLVFIVLTLISFAGISYATARADLRLSEAYHSQIIDSIEARNEAQLYLAELDERLSNGDVISDDSIIEERFSAGENSALILTIKLTEDPSRHTHYTLLSEQILSTVSYDYDESLPVLKQSDVEE